MRRHKLSTSETIETINVEDIVDQCEAETIALPKEEREKLFWRCEENLPTPLTTFLDRLRISGFTYKNIESMTLMSEDVKQTLLYIKEKNFLSLVKNLTVIGYISDESLESTKGIAKSYGINIKKTSLSHKEHTNIATVQNGSKKEHFLWFEPYHTRVKNDNGKYEDYFGVYFDAKEILDKLQEGQRKLIKTMVPRFCRINREQKESIDRYLSSILAN